MMRVLLLSPPFLPGYMRNARCDFVSLSGTQWYPLLMGYCGAWLEKCGHEVQLIDAPAYKLTHRQTEKMAVDFKPHWLIVYTGRLSEDNDIIFTDKLTEKIGSDSVIVGPFASIAPNSTLNKAKFVKYLVRGEFELPVREIIEGREKSGIANLVYKQGDEIMENPERPYLSGSQLDSIPFVSRFFQKHLDIGKYRAISEPYPFMDIMTGRGCAWGRCTYCLWVSSYIKGPVYNGRSMDNVIGELEFISRDMPEIKGVMLEDDTLFEERAVEFCEAKLKAGIKLSWSCYTRADISDETLKLMKRAGCLNLHVGFESADEGILRKIKKGITKQRMEQFARDAKQAGLRIHGDFAVGFPGETKESVGKTIDWACQMRPHSVQFQLMIPFAGTAFYEELEEKAWIKDGAPDYPEISREELEVMAKRAYRRFYVSPQYLIEVLKHPRELFFSRLWAYRQAIPSVLWRKYMR